MIRFKARAEMLGRTEMELRSEMAAALGRISGTLSQLIEQMAEIRKEFPGLTEPHREKKQLLYRDLHSRARLYYWYLVVQRESIGIRNHETLPSHFPIPDATLS